MSSDRLGIGIIGSGFNARFHLQAFVGVRDADVRGVWSPSAANAESAAELARSLGVGPARAYGSITEMVADPAIDALWLCGPNHARIENVEEIVHAVESGAGTLKGIACEKPLARNLAEARRVAELVKRTGMMHGYLENQAFAPQVVTGHALLWARGAAATGRPYLARAAEEHGGPHAPWFWQGELQGGGVLNDMMCHSALVVRHLLTEPGASLRTLRPVKVTAHIASLKWTRPEYARQLAERYGPAVDYTRRPAEDFASLTVEFETPEGLRVLGEVGFSLRGYQNFDNDDKSRNTLWFDFLTAGELFQNNHHKFAMSPNFAARWFENSEHQIYHEPTGLIDRDGGHRTRRGDTGTRRRPRADGLDHHRRQDEPRGFACGGGSRVAIIVGSLEMQRAAMRVRRGVEQDTQPPDRGPDILALRRGADKVQ